MNKDKQIEEMAMLVCRHTNTKMCADGTCPMTWECPLNIKTVEALYNAGYRKASDVASEIFEEIENSSTYMVADWGNELRAIGYCDFAEIKKKYTEGEDVRSELC